MKNWFWVFMAASCVCLTSGACSEEEEGDDSYTLGVDSYGSSSATLMVEMRRITDAFVTEFGAETFTLNGDKAKNDKSVAERFNKVAAAFTLSPDFTGYIVYSVSRAGNILASHRFENQTCKYDLAWDDMSPSGVPLTELSSIEKIFRTRLNSNSSGEYTVSGADEAACDAQVKKLFAEIGASITLSAEWTGYAVFTSNRLVENRQDIEVASYRFEK